MKILSINKFYFIKGGSDRCFFELNELLEKNGHTVIPFSMHHPNNQASPYSEFFVSNIDFFAKINLFQKLKAASRILYSQEARRKLSALLEKTQPQLAHLHLIYHQISPAILPVLKQYNIPIIQTLHDYKPICGTYQLLSGDRICELCKGKKFYYATLQRCNKGSLTASVVTTLEMYLHHALGWYDLPDVYITPSNFMRNKMIEFGLPVSKLAYLPNFVDPNRYPYSPYYEDYFLYAGRLIQYKGVKTLLLAMQRLKNVKIKLLILGDGPQRAELEGMRDKLKLDNVIFLGFQSTEQLLKHLSGSAFTVAPSELYENCPMAVLESMSMGKPVIGARIGGIPELIDHGVDGLLFEAGNPEDLASQLRHLARSRQQSKLMGLAARKKIETFYSPAYHYEQTMALYRRFL